MATIVHFPDSGHRVWKHYAQMLGGIATENGYGPNDVSAVVDEMKPFFLEAFAHPTPSPDMDMDEYLARLNEWVSSYSLRLLTITLLAKLQLREATGHEGTNGG